MLTGRGRLAHRGRYVNLYLNGLYWSAHNDWLRVGQNRVRVYRVRAKLFDKHEAVAYFSRAGEVLKVVLPDGLVLANEALPNLGKE